MSDIELQIEALDELLRSIGSSESENDENEEVAPVVPEEDVLVESD